MPYAKLKAFHSALSDTLIFRNPTHALHKRCRRPELKKLLRNLRLELAIYY